MKRIFLSLSVLILILATVAFARDIKRLEHNIEADREIKTIHLKSDIGAARFNLSTHDGGAICEISVRYDADKIKSDVEFEKSGNSAELFLYSSQKRKHFDVDTDYNRWKSSLSTDYNWDIDLDIGFAESKIDLSGLPLEKFNLDIGAAELRLEFSRPNPIRMKRFTINAGAGELEFIGLGYANFDHLDFDGGAGEFYLDFSGMTDGRHSVSIDAGVGELRIELPEDFPVRLDIDDSWLSSVELVGNDLDEVDDNLFESEDFDKGKDGLEIDLDIGIGLVTISRVGSSDKRIIYRSRGIYGNHPQAPLPGRVLIQNGYSAFVPRILALPSIPALPSMPALPALTPITPLAPIPDLLNIRRNSERSTRKVE